MNVLGVLPCRPECERWTVVQIIALLLGNCFNDIIAFLGKPALSLNDLAASCPECNE